MTGVSISPVVRHEAGACIGGGDAAPGLAFWLGLAAAPTFAAMALWSALFSSQPDPLCRAMQGSSPMSGMTVMYLLMSAFHMAPWLRLISGRLKGSRRALVWRQADRQMR
jgi:hypothetical protein